MEYERIEKKAQGGGFSPKKLRSMLLGVEKKRKEEEEFESSSFTMRSQASEIDESGGSGSDNCKDVDVVSVLPGCLTSTTADSVNAQMAGDRRFKDHSAVNSRIRSQEGPSLDYDSGYDNVSMPSSIFEFQKAERAQQRLPHAPFSKPAPSKWDDAHKWIASPSNRPKTGQPHLLGGQGAGSRKMGNVNFLNRQLSAKLVEVSEQKIVSMEEPDTKQIDPSHAKRENGVQKFVTWEVDPYPIVDSYAKPVLMVENSVGESTINLSQHDSSLAIHSASAFIPPPSTARSVAMRDMGTEMTPIASQEPSRNGTPVRATTPICSPTSSRPLTPGRTATASSQSHLHNEQMELSEKELQMKTRREIMALGAQLGKVNIAAWASKEEENNGASTSLKNLGAEQAAKSSIETRAATWEEAEKAKYLARFKREEMKIQAWENHQKAKTEAEMRKIECLQYNLHCNKIMQRSKKKI
ncbi:uncharacterized protein LOC119998957 isoform X2 [Tripterygium wilfordii]|uniref:uncharacterized protein LOC119998957 isoform X2 n=1 Tax=Tripterygium wilfordii TaxID=458696 RepID=UPI0018F82C54|nr:uncharacterized protein LOC119998957 isoform X2 [Tripterygium wilfordii]